MHLTQMTQTPVLRVVQCAMASRDPSVHTNVRDAAVRALDNLDALAERRSRVLRHMRAAEILRRRIHVALQEIEVYLVVILETPDLRSTTMPRYAELIRSLTGLICTSNNRVTSIRNRC